MNKGAFTRRGMLRIAGGLGLSGAAQAAKPAFTGASLVGGVAGSGLESPVANGVDGNWNAFRPVERLFDLQRTHASRDPYRGYDHDIEAMKSWAPWAKALKQRQRDYERMNAMDKLKAKYGITW